MGTIITKGIIKCRIVSSPSSESDGFCFTVLETGFKTTSEQIAINHVFRYINKKMSKLSKRQKKMKPTRTKCGRKYERTLPKKNIKQIVIEFNKSVKGMAMIQINGNYEMIRRTKNESNNRKATRNK